MDTELPFSKFCIILSARARATLTTLVKTMFQNILKALLVTLSLYVGNTAWAFTLIVPDEQISPSNAITDTLTLDKEIAPIVNAIRAQLFGARRANKRGKTAQYGNVLAANHHVDRVSDFEGVRVAYNDLAADGGGVSVAGGGSAKGLWITSAYSSLKNDFSRTSFDGDIHNLSTGFDFTQSDKYVFGVAVSHETSRYRTTFNVGNEKTSGFNISPYFAVLLSDSWSFDASLGHGKFNTDQSRAFADPLVFLTPVVVNSEFSSTRDFVSTNVTHVSALGNWSLTESIGFLGVKQKQDGYIESNGTGVVAGSSDTRKQWNLAGEVAYSHGDSESYVGLNYDRIINPKKTEFTSGEQPANDPDSFLLTAGWRHFGKDLTASFVFSSRLGQDQAADNGFSTTIRVNF